MADQLFRYTRQTPSVVYARSREHFFKNNGLYEDKTKYAAAHHQVCAYKSFPNRASTPLKSPFSPSTKLPQLRTPGKSHHPYVASVMGSFASVPAAEKKRLLGAVKTFSIPEGPRIVMHKEGTSKSVANDYHNRETNPGFARNDLGGMFTH